MKSLPTGWKNAVRREMTPSWFGWMLIAVMGGLIVAWLRGLGADLFYPVQYAVTYWISADAGMNFVLWLVMCATAGGYIAFGPIMAVIACGPSLWSQRAFSWAVWALLAWSLTIVPMNTIANRWWWREFHEEGNLFAIFDFFGWMGFFVLAWFMTRSRWVVAGLLALWLLQRNAFWFEPIALRSILWHAALFAVFFGWALRKRMSAMPVSTEAERSVRVSHADAAMIDPQARLA